MVRIIQKEALNASVFRLVLDAPMIAKKAEPGQFVIVRVDAEGERIPLTVADYDREAGTLSLVVQIVGATTLALSQKRAGDTIADLVGPLGVATHTEGLRSVCVVGGGVGCAIAYPIAKKLKALGARVDAVIGFRNKDMVILADEFGAVANELCLMTDDGTAGSKGLVTDALRTLLSQNAYDEVIAIGPLVMMKFVCKLTKTFGVKTVVSMNPVMIDGTGMCGGCRLTVGGKMKFACIDGPDFDGHEVDFDEAIARSRMYEGQEKRAYDSACNLLKGAK